MTSVERARATTYLKPSVNLSEFLLYVKLNVLCSGWLLEVTAWKTARTSSLRCWASSSFMTPASKKGVIQARCSSSKCTYTVCVCMYCLLHVYTSRCTVVYKCCLYGLQQVRQHHDAPHVTPSYLRSSSTETPGGNAEHNAKILCRQ